MRTTLLICVAAIAAAASAIQPAHAYTVPLPGSMASAGDSITRAYDIDWLHLLSDSPHSSWSTGSSSSVNSQYRRILALNSAINGKAYNDAKTGAKMIDLDSQALTAASQGVQ